MKKVLNSTKENMQSLAAICYALKYLRCIVTQAQMEKLAINVFVYKRNEYRQKLIKLNNKHNRLTNNLYKQRMILEKIA